MSKPTYDELKERCEQLEVQLAGCGVAALGWNQQKAKPEDYGYSASYADVLVLREKYEALLKLVPQTVVD